MMDSYIQMVFAFGAVLGLLLIFYGFTLRRRQTERSLINIIAYRVLDPKRGVAVAVMKIGEEILFIGITPNDMRILKKMPDTEVRNHKSAVNDLRSEVRNKDAFSVQDEFKFRTSDLRSLTSAMRKRLNEDN
ncbi:MAG: flagellar biosynthetic protein FliO [Thermodesulfovibrionales bacterium]|nr:flagellar biosynthetic protein FliO [Thermodesulfovibrionales bacterium]